MQMWQIASGDSSRDYSQLCIAHDVMLIGPGSNGPFDPEEYAGEKMANQIKSFVQKPSSGDIVLLRNGHRVVGVGRVPEEAGYEWSPCFDDVLGWDLQHIRRVLWSENALSVLDEPESVFANYKQQRTFTGVHENRLTSLLPELHAAIDERELKDLPVIEPPLEDEEVGLELFAAGLANDAVEKVLTAIRRARRLQEWYWTGRGGMRPSETEAVAHMIVPVLLGLGWSEQLLGIEWRRVDLAVFDSIPTDADRCVMVCEAKSPGHGLTEVFEQAKQYVERLDLGNCSKIMTTDGTRILLYERATDHWSDEPVGYVNLFKIRRSYLMPRGVSGIRTLMTLVPGRISHRLGSGDTTTV